MNALWEIVLSNALLVVVLAVGVAVAGRFWKNPLALHLLWLLVLLKFVTPPLMVIGLPLLVEPSTVVSDQPTSPSPGEELTSHGEEVTFPGEEAMPAAMDRQIGPLLSEKTIARPDAGVDVPPHLAARERFPWLIVLTWIWCLGIVCTVLWQARRILRFQRLLRAAEPASSDLLQMAAEVGQQLGLRQVPPIRMLPVRISPLVWSPGFRPQLVLPMELFQRLEPTAQRSILAHELAHVRRKDHLARLLELLVSTLFWWHPVAWWACRELKQIEELCCDAMVVGMAPSSRRAYVTALLDTLDFLCEGSIAAPLGATAAKSPVLLERRIAMMKNRTGVMRLTFGRLVLLVLVAAVPMGIAFAGKSPPSESGSMNSAANRSTEATEPTVALPQIAAEAAFSDTDSALPANPVKPANETSPAAPLIGQAGNPSTEQAKVIAEIEKLGGKVTIDEKTPGKPVISVDFRGNSVTDAELAYLQGMTQLKSLNLMGTKITDAGLVHLKGLTKLQSLNLTATEVDDAGLEHLTKLLQLQSLNLQLTQVTDAGLVYLKGLTQLQDLNLYNTRVTNAGLAHLKGMTQLKSLNLWHTHVTDAGLERLKGLLRLHSLNLMHTETTDKGLANVKGLTQLQMLDLSATRVTDAGLAHVGHLTNLQSLNLAYNRVSDAGLAHVKGLTQLQSLWLGKTQVTDAGLAYVKGLTKLQLLDLWETQVTDAGLADLKGLTKLQWLDLCATKITDAGLAHVEGLTRLRGLYLINTKVTDAGLEHLKGLTQLRWLYLGATQVTDASVKKLQQVLPNCKIDCTILDENTPVSTIPSPNKASESATASPSSAIPKANDQSNETSAAKPADEVSPASDQSATKEGVKTESKPAPAHGLTEEPNPDQVKATAEIEKLGGTVWADEESPGKPIIGVYFANKKMGMLGRRTGSSRQLTEVFSLREAKGLVNLEDVSRFHILKFWQLSDDLMQKTKVTDAGLASLNGLPQVQVLSLWGTKVTDAGLANIKGLTQLHDLNLRETQVTDAGLVHLEGLTKLQSLNLWGMQVTDAGLVNLKRLTQLHDLNLSDTQVTDAGLANLKELSQLQTLCLSKTKVTDAGLAHLKGLTKLQWLTLSETRVTDAGLEHLKTLTSLQALGLAETKLTDTGLEYLKALLPNLRALDLCRTQVTDVGLEHLKGLTELQSLFVVDTQVTDAGLEHLKGLTKLHNLGLRGTKVTDEGVKKLRQALPTCIIRDFPRSDAGDSTSSIPSPDKTSESAPASPGPATPKANDQSNKTSTAKPADKAPPKNGQPLNTAVTAYTREAARLGVKEPPLTEEEVIAAIRGWNRTEQKVDDETYSVFQKIADSKSLPAQAKLVWRPSRTYRGSDYMEWSATLTLDSRYGGENFARVSDGYTYYFPIRGQLIRNDRPGVLDLGGKTPGRADKPR